jgi:tRNA(Ile)-lysidine synthase
VDEKIPRHKRDKIILVCDGSHVMWVVGYRISEYYKISNNTTRVLEIVYGGTGNE